MTAINPRKLAKIWFSLLSLRRAEFDISQGNLVFTKDEKTRIRNEIEYDVLKQEELNDLANLITETRNIPFGEPHIRSHSKDYYNWMYFRNPAGKAWVYGARHNGKLVGSFAMAPKRIKIGDSAITCGKTMDMFTAPDYQGCGLMSQISTRVFDAAKRDGTHIWYVTPSDKSYPIFLKKWGYVEPFEIKCCLSVLSVSGLLASKVNFAKLAAISKNTLGKFERNFYLRREKKIKKIYEIESITSFGDEIDEFWNRISAAIPVGLIRDSQYMNWRYIDNPDQYQSFVFRRNKECCGVLVLKYTLRKGMRIGEIVDLVCQIDDESAIIDMIRYGLSKMQEDGCIVCQAWQIPDTRMARLMKKAGLRINHSTVKFLLSPNAPYSMFYMRENWLIAQGDGNDI